MKTNVAVKTDKQQHLRLVKKGTHRSVKVLYFRLVVAGAIFLTIISLSRVIQYSLYNQYSLENQNIIKMIDANRKMEQELGGKVLALKSPLRIEKKAKELKMEKPSKVGYLIFEVKKNNKEIAYKR